MTIEEDMIDYFRISYEQFMGASTKEEITYRLYTLEEQVERYVNNLTFWNLQLDKMNNTRCKHKDARIKFVKAQIERLLHTVEHIFPPDIPPLISQMVVYHKNNILIQRKNRRKQFFTPPEVKRMLEQRISSDNI